MMMTMLKPAVLAALVVLGIAGPTPRAVAQRDPNRGTPRTEIRGVVKSVDATANAITLLGAPSRDKPAEEKTYTLAKGAEIALAVGTGAFGGRGSPVAKEGKLGDLAAGTQVALTLSADGKTVEGLLAEGQMVRGALKAADAQKNTLTIVGMPNRRDEAGEEKTYTLAPGAEIGIDDGRGRRFSVTEGKLSDLATGSILTLWLSVDQKHVHGVLAQGPTLFGQVKSVDAAKNNLVVTLGARGGEAEERTIDVAKNAMTVLDDGKGRRLSVKEAKLGDIPVGSTVAVRLSPDQKFATMIRAEGAMVAGRLKILDAPKNSIVIEIFVARGENPVEKTYSIAKDARITVDGVETKLADVKVEDGMFAQLRLSLDQKTVQGIMLGRPRSRE